MTADLLVVGGGVAGLACAVALADAGLRVTVLEAAALPGGRAGSVPDRVTGEMLDVGPHVITSEHRQFLALLQRLGTADQVLWQPQPLITLREPQGRVQRMRSAAWPPPLHMLPNLPRALRSVSVADVLSNLRAGWQLLRLDTATLEALDARDALQWLRDCGVRPRFIDWFWSTACLALLNVPLQQCSAGALARTFRYLAVRSGYCFGFPRAGLAELFAPGAQRVIEAAGGSVLMEAHVVSLQAGESRGVEATLADGRRFTAQGAVLALPPQALAAIDSPLRAQAARWARRFLPSPYVSTYLWFDRKLTTERFWARVRTPQDLNLDFYDLSNIRPGPAGAPSLIAANCVHAHAAATLDDAEIVRRTMAELAQFAPGAQGAGLRHSVVHRIPMAVACPHPGTETARPPADTDRPHLWLAGDWTRTQIPSSMESAARSGVLAAMRAGACFGRQVPPVLPLPEPQGLAAWLAPPDAPAGPPPR